MTEASFRSRLGRLLTGLVALVLVAVGIATVVLGLAYQRFADQPLSLPQASTVLMIERGDGFRTVIRRLRSAGIGQGHDLMWKALAWEMDAQRRLQAGEYALDDGITPRELLLRLARGDVIQHRFTIVEGWNFRELRQALAANQILQQTLPELSDEEVMRRLGAEGQHPEGRFLPETYQFTRGMQDLDLLRRAYAAMQRALDQAWQARADGLPLESPDEVLIMASIIEKETGQSGERREISGVFARRMRLGMRLQTDPTVIYGVGEAYAGRITRAHLTTDTPWNTYTRAGLPPTPIAMPGRAALMAAVDPAPGDTLYFVSRNDGSHQFSRTLDEHNAAVRRYQLGRP
jgi:UPF0755 protein